MVVAFLLFVFLFFTLLGIQETLPFLWQHSLFLLSEEELHLQGHAVVYGSGQCQVVMGVESISV